MTTSSTRWGRPRRMRTRSSGWRRGAGVARSTGAQPVADGSPFLRLIRHEVEALVAEKYGPDYLKKKQLKKDLAEVNKTLRQLKSQALMLEERKAELLKRLGDQDT